ncbi:MAG: T9SS type A sorting domain-containing protein [Marinoscillum sp.]
MRSFWFVLYMWCCTTVLNAQHLVRAEYFFDSDPGVGQGVALDFTSGEELDETLTIPTTGLTPGFHLLYLRYANSSGIWTHAQTRSVYIESTSVTNAIQSELVTYEYFFNSDPGVGKGTVVTLPASSLYTEEIMVPIANLSPGFNLLYLRFKNADGLWSHSQSRSIYIESTEALNATLSNISSYEYFFNQDPGVGKGTVVNVESSASLETSLTVEAQSLPRGFSLLYLRFKNEQGLWSHSQSRAIFVESLGSLSNESSDLVAYEYFFDLDPGFGNGQLVSISGSSYDENFTISIPSMTTGFHQLLIRFKNEQGVWSDTQSRSFYIESAAQSGEIAEIVAAEYYFDNDPGVGKATGLFGLTGSEIQKTFLLPTQNLTEGKHQIFLRVKNTHGSWSMAEHDEFTLCGEILPTPDISGSTEVCAGETLTLEASQVAGALSYYWKGPNGFTSTDRQLALEASNTNAGTYEVWAVRGEGQCDSSNVQTVELTIYDTPELVLSTTSVEACFFESVDLTGLYTDSNDVPGTVAFYKDAQLTEEVEFPNSVTTSGVYYITKTSINDCSDVQTVDLNFIHCRVDQSITFESLDDLTYGVAPVNLLATATSGLPVSYTSSNTNVATVEGNLLTIVGAGNTAITAVQLGNEDYFEASSVEQLLQVSKAEQQILFDELYTYYYSDESFELEATSTSGLAITYTSSNEGVAIVSGNVVSIVGIGLTFISANQGGNSNYYAAVAVEQPLMVIRTPQFIEFEELGERGFNEGQFELSATASSGLPVFYESSNSSVAVVFENTVSIISRGSTQITARQPGNDFYDVAESVVRTLVIGKGNQVITFEPLPSKLVGDADFQLAGQVNSGLTIAYSSSDLSVASVSGNVVTIHGFGTTIITANQAGNGDYNPASGVSQSLTVNKKSQTITFESPGTKRISDGFLDLTGTSTSGLAVSYASLNTDVAIISGNRVAFIGLGSVEIVASQEGNHEFEPAEQVSRELIIEKAVVLSNLQLGDFRIYPNPVGEVIHIEVTDLEKDGAIQASLFTLGGNRLIIQILRDQHYSLDVRHIPAGIYLLRLDYQDRHVIHKIIIQ